FVRIFLGFVVAKSLQSAEHFAYNPPHLHNPDGRRLEPAFYHNEGVSPRKERRGMTSTMMMDRTSMGVQGVTGVHSPVGVPTVSPASPNWLMVPRCTFKYEKCQGGMKVHCVCDDPMAKSMMQNLCTALMGGMCSICCTLNGVTVCCCNL